MVENTLQKTKLSIRKGVDSFVFLNQSGDNSIIKGSKSFDDKLTSEEHFTFISSSERVVIIPNQFYSEGSQQDIISSQLSYDSDSDVIFKSDINCIESVCLFVENKANLELRDGIELSHDAIHLINYSENLVKSTNGLDDLIVINILGNQLQITVFKNNQFQLFNSYPTSSKTDFLYFLLLVTKQLGLKNDTQLYVSGDIISDSKLFEYIKEYFIKIEMAPQPIPLSNCSGSPYLPQDLILWSSLI